jgi:hypothetical protein
MMTDKLLMPDDLAERMLALVNDHRELSDSECLVAAMMVVADIVAAIDCKQCREKASQSVKKLLPDFIKTATEQNPCSGAGHLH